MTAFWIRSLLWALVVIAAAVGIWCAIFYPMLWLHTLWETGRHGQWIVLVLVIVPLATLVVAYWRSDEGRLHGGGDR